MANEEKRTSQGGSQTKTSPFGEEVRQGMREFGEEASHQASELRDKASEAARGLRDKMSGAKEGVKELGREAADFTKEKLSDLREGASEYYKEGKKKANQVLRSVEDYIHDQPIKSILIASGIGLLVGIIWKRSRSA